MGSTLSLAQLRVASPVERRRRGTVFDGLVMCDFIHDILLQVYYLMDHGGMRHKILDVPLP